MMSHSTHSRLCAATPLCTKNREDHSTIVVVSSWYGTSLCRQCIGHVTLFLRGRPRHLPNKGHSSSRGNHAMYVFLMLASSVAQMKEQTGGSINEISILAQCLECRFFDDTRKKESSLVAHVQCAECRCLKCADVNHWWHFQFLKVLKHKSLKFKEKR
jgi:hypothetical protein